METCRLCLWKGEDKKCMVFTEDDSNLPLKIKNCVSVEITENDQLPKSVCIFCVQKVNDWHNFKEMCLKSENTLKLTGSKFKDKVNTREKVTEEIVGEGNEIVTSENEAGSKSDEESWKFSEYEDSECEQQEDFSAISTYKNGDLIHSQHIYECDICSKEFHYCLDYLDHQNVHDGQLVFKCDECTEVFNTRKELVEHDAQHRRPCPCPKCGKLILKSSMKLHLIQHTDRHMCPKCSHRFASKATLQQHIVTVHTNIRDHICDACGKRFASKTSMNVHLKTHSDERLYSCKLCSYAGRTSSAIYIHMATHANEVHICPECSKTFKSNRNLSDHIRRVHSNRKRHECSYCEKRFVDRYMLMVHVRSHTGVRPFKCSLCDKAFIRSDSLKEHMVTHGTRTLYDCSTCTKKFTSKRGATRHQCAHLS